MQFGPAPLSSQFSLSLFPSPSPIPTSNDLPSESHEIIDVDATISSSQGHGLSLVKQLRDATSRLPNSLLVATPDDELFRFSGDAYEQFRDSEDPWEGVDRELNAVIGWSRKPEDIVEVVKRGPLGMDGLCNWLEVCVRRLGIDGSLLEGKCERLLAALNL